MRKLLILLLAGFIMMILIYINLEPTKKSNLLNKLNGFTSEQNTENQITDITKQQNQVPLNNLQSERETEEKVVQTKFSFINDADLIEDPFGFGFSPENIKHNLEEKLKMGGSTTTIIGHDTLLTFKIDSSYMIVSQNNGKYELVEAKILTPDISLRKGIKVGITREYFNSIYPEANQYAAKYLIIRDISDFFYIHLNFNENDILAKITCILNEYGNY